jgi:Cyclic nucleotide-binding domain/Acetyltransferase (GNAT) domain
MKNVVSLTNLPFMDNSDQSIKVSFAVSEQEKFRIYRLRYQVYVEEMGRQLPSADHKNRLVFDELDEKGFLVYAQAGSEVIGTIRQNIGTAEEFSPELVCMFCMDIFRTFDKGRHKFCFTSKYIVAPAYRRSSTAYLVVAWSYEFWRDGGEIQFCFAGCNPNMIPLYERLGFRRFADNFYVPEYGCMVPLVLVMEDESHLRAVGSPFYRKARRFRNNPAAANWFIKEFPTTTRFVNSSLTSKEELWLILKEKFGQSPQLAIPILNGLTEQEAKEFVHIGVVHMYKKGERIISFGDFCHEMNILVIGILEVNNPAIDNPLDTMRVSPGGLFGRVALSEIKKQTVYVTALTEVEFLVISNMAFAAFCHNHPVIAHKVIRNIGSRADIAKDKTLAAAR